ncbi:MAG: NfeD family protein [Terrimicrobiaceae bacterium]|nr:NfeD family protein [Terrimicrobiaceae bacterium]
MMRILLAVALLVTGLVPGRAAEPEIRKGSVVVVPIDGAVSDAQFFFLRRILKKAEAGGAAAILLNMDTPGGALKTTEQIVQMLMKSPVPSYTYVNTNAGSAGALIALGTKAVYMAPISAIGAAAPVVGGGQEIPATMNAKIVSYYSGYFRSVAETNGYHPELVDGFMNLDKEVKVGDVVINPKGALLTLSAQEAVKEVGGRPLLASGIAKDIAELCKLAGLDASAVVEIEPSGFEKLAQWITALAPIFLLAGIIGAYIEIKSPGFGVAGILAAVSFLIFFAGHYIAGLTGLEVVAVFALGIILILIELIFFPGVVFLAALGVALMLGALFFAMVDYYPAQPLQISFDVLAMPMLNLGIAILASVLIISLLARFLPDMPLFRRLLLNAQLATGPSIPAPVAVSSAGVRAGDTGAAISPLRPAGKARVGETIVDVVTDGEFLPAGTEIRILAVEGSRILVEKA